MKTHSLTVRVKRANNPTQWATTPYSGVATPPHGLTTPPHGIKNNPLRITIEEKPIKNNSKYTRAKKTRVQGSLSLALWIKTIFKAKTEIKTGCERATHGRMKLNLPVEPGGTGIVSPDGLKYDETGCKRVAQAVILQAVKDAQTTSKTHDGRWRARTALEWLEGPECQYLCDVTGIEHDWILRNVKKPDNGKPKDSRKAVETHNQAARSFHMAYAEIESL